MASRTYSAETMGSVLLWQWKKELFSYIQYIFKPKCKSSVSSPSYFFFPLKNNKNLGKQYTPWLLQKRSLAQSQDACLSNTQKVTPCIPLARNNSQHDESTRKSIAYYNTLRGAIAVRAMWGNALAWTITFYMCCIHEYELYYNIWHAMAFDLLWLMTPVLLWPLSFIPTPAGNSSNNRTYMIDNPLIA